MSVKAPGGIFSFLAALSFTFSSLFSDILIIRVSLLFAYIVLLITGALGNPLWPGVEGDGAISLETIVFSAINVVTQWPGCRAGRAAGPRSGATATTCTGATPLLAEGPARTGA